MDCFGPLTEVLVFFTRVYAILTGLVGELMSEFKCADYWIAAYFTQLWVFL
jgi:hypothetical protein